jgi:hypothetical protein
VSGWIGKVMPPPALLIESTDGATYWPSAALMAAIPRLLVTAKSYER